MKTCRIPYENACRTGFRNLSNIKWLPLQQKTILFGKLTHLNITAYHFCLRILFILHALPSILSWSSFANMPQKGKIWKILKENEKDCPFPFIPHHHSTITRWGYIHYRPGNKFPFLLFLMQRQMHWFYKPCSLVNAIIPHVPEKAGLENYLQIWWYVIKLCKKSSLVYISNCLIVYLSLAKKQEWFID